MHMTLYQYSALLLEKVANSVFDRNPLNPNPLFFTIKELHIVEDFLRTLLEEEKENKGPKVE